LIAMRLLKRSVRAVLDIAGRVYVPGDRLEDALRVGDKVDAMGRAVTVGYFPHYSDSPGRLLGISCSIIEALASRYDNAYPSIKPPAFGYDFGLIAEVANRANLHGLLVHFDSHEIFTAEPTFDLLEKTVAIGGQVGITLPGRWRRSVEDAQLIRSLGVRPRLVKGEWADPYDPKRDRTQGFLEMVDSLSGYKNEVALATHDADLLRESLGRLASSGTPCQVELLNGLPQRKAMEVAQEFGVGVRIYVPFGKAWRPYAMSKCVRDPRILLWVMSDALQGAYSVWRQ